MLTVTYILGITMMVISEILDTLLLRRLKKEGKPLITKTQAATGQYLYKQQAVFDLVGKNHPVLNLAKD